MKVILSAVFALSAAAPSLSHHHVPITFTAPVVTKHVELVETPIITKSLEKVGEVVNHIPTGVSHHSSSVIHETAQVVKEIHTPIEKHFTRTVPIVKSTPVLKTVYPAPVAVHHTPLLLKTHLAPITTGWESPALLKSGWESRDFLKSGWESPLLRSW